MNKKHQAVLTILSLFIILNYAGTALGQDACASVIFDSSDIIVEVLPTSETSKTQQAAYDFIALSNLRAEYGFFIPGPWTGTCYYLHDLFGMGTYGAVCIDGLWEFYGHSNIPYTSGTWDVICGADPDEDTIPDGADNCPAIANPNQEDADSDNIGDVCDNNTIYGHVSGDIQSGVSLTLQIYSCGLVDLEGTTTDENGYYAFGGLQNRSYVVGVVDDNYTFDPPYITLPIPQTEIQSYDFTATNLTCEDVDRFLDNGDGTVTDCRTGLVWLKNANCYAIQDWDSAMSSAAGLNSGECGLTDGSVEGDWHLAAREELEGIITDRPTTGDTETPGAPFVSVQSNVYWSSTEDGTNGAWGVDVGVGYSYYYASRVFRYYYVWPVRSDN